MSEHSKKQSKKSNKRPIKIEKRVHFSIWYIIFGIMIMYLLETMILKETVVKLPYSEFKEMVRKGQIKDCLISQDKITGRFFSDPAKLDSLYQAFGFLPDTISNAETLKSKRKLFNAWVDSLAQSGPIRKRGEAVKGLSLASFSTTRVEDPELVNQLEAMGIQFSGQPERSWLLNFLLVWVFPLLILVAIWGFIFRRMNPTGGMLSIGKSKAKVYVEGQTKVTFKDVAGIDEAVEEVKEVVEFLKNPAKFQSLGGRIPKGVLLVGPPGTGKTLLAKAVAGEAGVPFFSMSGSDFVEMFVGVGAARVRDLFQQAAQRSPCIIFIDELDALGKARSISPVTGGHDEREQTLNQLLTEMDGFDPNIGVIIMAATNRPEILDLALLRPGRFDRQVVVDRPDINGREAILKVHARGVKLSPDVDLRVIAARTPGFVGADLANVINEAALLAARRNKNIVSMEELEEAIDRVIAGLERKSRVLNKHEKEIVAYHESGHAIVGASLPNTDPVHRVSIIPRGVAALGYTLQLPTEDRYLMTRSELESRLKVLLGGRVAEEITFNEISTGAQNDLERATQIARSMVVEYGMSEKLGPLSYGSSQRGIYLGIQMPESRPYSEQIAAEIDNEVRKIVESAYNVVKELLINKKQQLEQLAKRLLEKEIVEKEELYQILGIEPPKQE
ncbi:MAG: ATP-dependent zinc metalloprotease FtsH [candidate division KSB1 bacterium]|nr:ATP-dependent zinc metalloprotease FtsH [candidate division KSB1 bacterium]MDZ7336755.1 ATP-dependent zinc metalloprotease FtsH [candidate division KSB1 bacterium]MDZ7375534.1 ATP-dependent zinc metalloprotease FtsH [candidate division KSB1 bacterium]MDZ7400116.1 ATP-dependent zinc metalloprotease FtsH [candidate division KSB1 bacterium]